MEKNISLSDNEIYEIRSLIGDLLYFDEIEAFYLSAYYNKSNIVNLNIVLNNYNEKMDKIVREYIRYFNNRINIHYQIYENFFINHCNEINDLLSGYLLYECNGTRLQRSIDDLKYFRKPYDNALKIDNIENIYTGYEKETGNYFTK